MRGDKIFPVLRGTVRLERSAVGAQIGLVGAAAIALDALFYETGLGRRHGVAPALVR